MRYSLLLIILLFSTSLYASKNIWIAANKGELSKFNKKSVIINGVLTHIKRGYSARDTYYNIKVKDENSDKYVEAKIYIIKWLKRVELIMKTMCNLHVSKDIEGKKRYNM